MGINSRGVFWMLGEMGSRHPQFPRDIANPFFHRQELWEGPKGILQCFQFKEFMTMKRVRIAGRWGWRKCIETKSRKELVHVMRFRCGKFLSECKSLERAERVFPFCFIHEGESAHYRCVTDQEYISRHLPRRPTVHPRHETDMEKSLQKLRTCRASTSKRSFSKSNFPYSRKPGESVIQQVRHDGERASRHPQKKELIHVMESWY